MYIYIYINTHTYIYIYIHNKYNANENKQIFLQKDAHPFTDLFASPEMSVRVCFEGETDDMLLVEY